MTKTQPGCLQTYLLSSGIIDSLHTRHCSTCSVSYNNRALQTHLFLFLPFLTVREHVRRNYGASKTAPFIRKFSFQSQNKLIQRVFMRQKRVLFEWCLKTPKSINKRRKWMQCDHAICCSQFLEQCSTKRVNRLPSCGLRRSPLA